MTEPTRPFGAAMQEVMARRGCDLTLDEAAEFSRSLLRLVELGVLVPVDDGRDRGGPPCQEDGPPESR